MTCCGNKRKNLDNTINQDIKNQVIWLQYIGEGSFTVTGRISHITYQFPYKGAKLAIDARDYNSLKTITTLLQAG